MKNKKSKNSIVQQIFNTTNLSAMVIAFVTTLLTIGGQYLIDNLKENKQIKDSAIIISSDLESSIDTIELTDSINKIDDSVRVLKNPHTSLNNSYINYLVNIKSKLNKDEYQSLASYYRNISFLEEIRMDYWRLDSQEKIDSKGVEYLELLKIINDLNNSINIRDILHKVKEIDD